MQIIHQLSKTQLSTIAQSGGFLGRLLRPLLKTGLPLIGNVLKQLAKTVLIPLRLTAAVASAANAAIQKKMFESGFTSLIISNEEMEDSEDSVLLIKGVSETIKNEVKEQKGVFLGMILRNLSASLLGNILTGKGTIRAGEGTIRARENF